MSRSLSNISWHSLKPCHASSVGTPDGFSWNERKNGDIVISRYGEQVVILRGAKAARFRTDVENQDEDELMARVTGNYKRGNER